MVWWQVYHQFFLGVARDDRRLLSYRRAQGFSFRKIVVDDDWGIVVVLTLAELENNWHWATDHLARRPKFWETTEDQWSPCGRWRSNVVPSLTMFPDHESSSSRRRPKNDDNSLEESMFGVRNWLTLAASQNWVESLERWSYSGLINLFVIRWWDLTA